MQNIQIETTISELYNDSKNDFLKMMKSAAKSIFRPMTPADFKDAYLSISQEQGIELVEMIKSNDIKKIVEFGTSFGISTLFLAQGALATDGRIVSTELIPSKAKTAIENFKRAGVNELIEVRVGDAMETLKEYEEPIDLLLLDGWKDLYMPLFQMLTPNYHKQTIIYVDNADMAESKSFLYSVGQDEKYKVEFRYGGKVALIRLN
jgi:predicted O-methyltransferase YrrM